MMRKNKKMLLTRLVFLCLICVHTGQTATAQSAAERFIQKKAKERKEYVERQKQKVDAFRLKKWQEFQNYRKQRNKQLIAYMSERWTEIPPEEPIPAPKLPDPVVPPTAPKHDKKEGKAIAIPHGGVIQPMNPSKPAPKNEIPPIPEELKRPDLIRKGINLFGTICYIATDGVHKIKMESIDEKNVAKAWAQLGNKTYEQIIIDCCDAKEDMHLNGWAMLNLCKAIADDIQGKGTNESAVVLVYLMNQLSYDVQLCIVNNKKLVPIFTSDVELCLIPRYKIGGKTYNLWCDLTTQSKVLFYEKLKYLTDVEPISFDHAMHISFDTRQNTPKQFTSVFNNRMTVTVGVNTSLVNYYNSLPLINDWSFYANQPMFPSVKAQVIPPLKRAVAGKSEIDAANDIIHLNTRRTKSNLDMSDHFLRKSFSLFVPVIVKIEVSFFLI